MSLQNWVACFTTTSVLLLAACSSVPPPETAPVEGQVIEKTQGAQDQDQFTKLQEKIQDLETRLSALNDKINLENGAKAEAVRGDLQTETVQTPSAHAKVIPTTKPSAKKPVKDPASDFTQNEAVDRYREAKILFDSKRYADAILEFADFVKNEPEHILAPAAQFFVGMGYYQQKEYKLAEEELNRGLIAYPHSSYTPDTLLALSQVSGDLQKPARVAYYKQKLLSNFPNSPQAAGISLDSVDTKPAVKKPRIESVEMPEAPVPPTVSEQSTGDDT
jgi:TolA-binding protein